MNAFLVDRRKVQAVAEGITKGLCHEHMRQIETLELDLPGWPQRSVSDKEAPSLSTAGPRTDLIVRQAINCVAISKAGTRHPCQAAEARLTAMSEGMISTTMLDGIVDDAVRQRLGVFRAGAQSQWVRSSHLIHGA
jgi:hypothetical protein